LTQRIFVTGGLGFIGSALVAELLHQGCSVTVFDNGTRGSLENVDADAIDFIRGDILDEQAIMRAVRSGEFDSLIHLAAMHFIPDCNRDPARCYAVNVVGTENVLSACAEAGISRIVAASSMAVYPILDGAIPETHPVGPYDVYGETKVANELQLGRWSRDGSDRTAIAIRLSNAFGPHETNPHVIPMILGQLRDGARELDLGNTAPLRDYVHTSDVARALATLTRAPLTTGFHVFNLGSGHEHSVADIIRILGEVMQEELTVRVSPAKVRSLDRMHLLPDVSRIEKEVGWAPHVELRDGLRQLAKWYGVPVSEVAE
jgi:UDP-glucose 4-epimerase